MDNNKIDFTALQSWTATMKLRWVNKQIPIDEQTYKTEKTLQQMWQGSMGEQKWKDIKFDENIIK